MASSEDFKKYIQAGKLTEALALAMSAAVKLQITTRVLGDEDMATGNDSQPGERIRTQINMVEGQITNEIGEQFTGKNPYKSLKQVHLEQVKEGAKTIQNNLKSLQKLFRVLVAMRQQNLLEVTPIDVTPISELNTGTEQSVLLPPRDDYAASGYEAIATPPAALSSAAYDLGSDLGSDRGEDIPMSESAMDYPGTTEEAITLGDPESAPEIDSEQPEIDPLVKFGLLATAGAATVAAVAGMTHPEMTATDSAGGRSLAYESLADLESNDEYNDEYMDEDSDQDRGDATVIQVSTVAYSASATYVPVPPLVVLDNTNNTENTVVDASDTSQLEDLPSSDAVEGLAQDISHEDWDDFGENLPIETVSQMPNNMAEVMAATLDATEPDPLSPVTPLAEGREEVVLELAEEEYLEPKEGFISSTAGDENLLEEDWDSLELSPLSASELSSFADTQEAAWEDDWEDGPDAIDLSRPMPPAPPIVMGYSVIDEVDEVDEVDLDIANTAEMDDHSWEEMEEEFKYVSSPTGRESSYGNNSDDNLDSDLDDDLDSDLDDDFEIIGEIIDTPDPIHNPFGVASDSMEDIFGDLDDNLLLGHNFGAAETDDFANFDLDDEPPSPYK